MSKGKKTVSKDFSDMTLAFGLIKRMNGYAFCYTGDAELVRLGFMIKTNPKVKPYITAKGKKFLMETYRPLADEIPEDKPPVDKKKEETQRLVKSLQNRPTRAYHEPDYWGDDEDDDEEDEVIQKKEKKEKPENDSQA